MQISDIYKALSDDSRLRILNIISHGSFNVQELTSILELGQSTISHHLKVLQSCGFAKSHREGTWIYYTLANGDTPSPAVKIAKEFLNILNQKEAGGILTEATNKDKKEINKILNRRRDQTRAFFDQNAPLWNDMRIGIPEDETFMNELLSNLDHTSTILDLGCGTGAVLKKILPRQGQTIGVDYSQNMLDEAKEALKNINSSIDLRLGNLEHLPVGDASIDIVVSYMVMHHIARPLDVLNETHRVLKPGGEFLIVDLSRHDNEYMRERFADLWLGFDISEFEKWLFEAKFAEITSKILGSKSEAFIVSCKKIS